MTPEERQQRLDAAENQPDSSYGWTLAFCWAGILYMSYRCWDMLAHPGPTDGWLGMTMAAVVYLLIIWGMVWEIKETIKNQQKKLARQKKEDTQEKPVEKQDSSLPIAKKEETPREKERRELEELLEELRLEDEKHAKEELEKELILRNEGIKQLLQEWKQGKWKSVEEIREKIRRDPLIASWMKTEERIYYRGKYGYNIDEDDLDSNCSYHSKSIWEHRPYHPYREDDFD